jgi:starch synthase
MYIVQLATECAPVAKVGGLGDVVYGLSRELQVRGNHVELILPKYDCLRYDQIRDLEKVYHDLWVPWYGSSIHCSVWSGEVRGLRCFLIEPHSKDNFFSRGAFYGYLDEVSRFALFSKASLEFLLKSGRRPDIIHCHDWQTGIVPVLLFEIYNKSGMWDQRVCYTIHNFKHQGVTGQDVLLATGLRRPDYFMHYDRMRDNLNPNAVNLMKGGIVYSNFVTTVSPHHAWEASCSDQGFGLQPTLQTHREKFAGVLNGIDYDVWNPEIDSLIPFRYSMETIEEKYRNKEALRERLWMRKQYKPLVAYVGRLDPQKGLNLIRHALFFCLEHNAQFVLLGSSPEIGINSYFWHLKNHLNDNPDCHLEIGFNEELSHLIYAGADMIVMPSMFEPCGLPQMIGLKYGAIPVVRAVGGLVDTVFDRDYRCDMPQEERNGYVFHQSDNLAIESALHRALGLWNSYPDEFRRLVLNAMRRDFSWSNSGAKYLTIYDHIRHK